MHLLRLGGNAPLLHTWPNALALTKLLNASWEVAKGAGWSEMQPAWPSLHLLASLIAEEGSQDAAEAIVRAADQMPAKRLNDARPGRRGHKSIRNHAREAELVVLITCIYNVFTMCVLLLKPIRPKVLMLGPATNLARAFRLAPWLPAHLKSVVLMGGELTGGRGSMAKSL